MARLIDMYFTAPVVNHWTTFYEKAFMGELIMVYIHGVGRRWVLLQDFRSNEEAKKLEFRVQIVPEPGKKNRDSIPNSWFTGTYSWETNDGYLKLPSVMRPLPSVILSSWINHA